MAEDAQSNNQEPGVIMKCMAAVPDPPWYFHSYRCTRRAVEQVAFEKGRASLCKQHANKAERDGGLDIVNHGRLKLKKEALDAK